MTELNARLRVEGLSDAEAAAVPRDIIHPDFFRRSEIVTLMTDAGAVDVLHNMPARDGTRRTYADLLERSVELVRGDVVVRVAALEDIIASKEWADRPKDRDALVELRRLAGRPPHERDSPGDHGHRT